MFGSSSRTVPAKEVQMQDMARAEPMGDTASSAGESAKYDDHKDDKLKFFNRMVVCGIAVVLLWCTSLSVSVLIVQNFIQAPSYNDIYDTCEYAYDVTVQQKDDYQECTDRQLGQCNSDFAQAYGNEEARVTVAFTHNSATLNTVAGIQSTCTSSFTSIQKALDLWSAEFEVDYKEDPESQCTEDDLERVKSLVGDVSALRSATFTAANNQVAQSEQRMTRMVQYTKIRAAYDAEYVDNKTASLKFDVELSVDGINAVHLPTINMSFIDVDLALDGVLACASLDNSSVCNFGGVNVGAAHIYDVMRADITSWMEDIGEALAKLEIDAALFKDAAEAAHSAMTEFYNAAMTTYNILSGFEAEINGIPGLSFSALGFDNWVTTPFSAFDIGDLQITNFVIPEPHFKFSGEIYSSVASAVTAARNAMDVSSIATFNAGLGWADALDLGIAGIDFTPNDYKPPKYQDVYPEQNITEDEELANQEADNEDFLAKTAVNSETLEKLAAAKESSDFSFKPLNLSQVDAISYLSGHSFTFEPLSGTSYDVKLWVIKIGSIGSYVVIFDYIWRVFQTLHLIYRFWSRGSLKMPTADIRKDRKKFNFKTMGKRRMVLAIFTSPFFFALLGLVFLIVLVWVIAAAYIPVYNDYVGACVEHTQNDTFLTANLYSIAYNYASEDGNENAFSGLESYNVMYTDYCSTYGKSTQTQQNEDELYLSSLSIVQDENVNNMGLLEKCLDVEAMNYYFEQACCDLEGYDECTGAEDPEYAGHCPLNEATEKPFLPVSTYLDDAECHAGFSAYSLQDGIFSCSALPICSLTCDGPDKQLLDSVTKQCGCMMEWGFHSLFFQVTIAIVVFALLNAARVLFMRGVMILNWKKLVPNLFEYVANCRRNGKFVEPNYRQKDVPYSTLLRQELDKKLKNFELMGYVLIFVAAVVNVPWVVFLSLASQDIKYDPEE